MPADTVERVIRPLALGGARCAELAQQVEESSADGKTRPLWRLNSGAAMLTQIEGLNGGQPVILIIDLESVRFDGPSIEMLREHCEWDLCGRWTELSAGLAGPLGPGIYGRPILYTPESEAEAQMWPLRSAAEVDALLKRGHPWQASVTVRGALSDYELLPPGESWTGNGQTFQAIAGDPPTYIGRNLINDEASVCRRGADRNSGPVAFNAKTNTTQTPPESSMDKIIQALLGKFPERHHGLIARLAAKGQTESEIVAKLMESADEDHNAALAKLTEEVASLKAGLATKDEEIAKLTAQLEDLKPKEEEEVPAGDGDSKTGANLAAPKTIKEGMARLTAGGSTLTGWDLRTAALKQWPALRATVPSMSGRAAAAG